MNRKKKVLSWKKVMVLVFILILFQALLSSCKSGNQLTGSSAFVDKPEELPFYSSAQNDSLPAASAPASSSPLFSNWMTGSLGW